MRINETVLSRPVSILGKLTTIFTAIKAFWERRRLVRQLVEFDDHLLRDIGITRQDVESALSGSLSYDPTVELALRAHQTRMGRRATALEQRRWSHMAAEAEAVTVSADRKVPQRAA